MNAVLVDGSSRVGHANSAPDRASDVNGQDCASGTDTCPEGVWYGMAYRFECPKDDCTFLLRTDVDREAEALGRAHARVAHRGRIAVADLERGLERVEA